MSRAMSRKEFLSVKGLLGAWRGVLQESAEEVNRQESLAQYFQSPFYSYPLLQEMPWEFLLEEAKKHNIPTEGRSKNDIARDLFSKTL